MPKIYYGEQTRKALNNFSFSAPPVSMEFIYAIAEIKKAAANANYLAGNLDRQRRAAIVRACEEILLGRLDGQFKLPVLQGGAGTSINMNVNEIVAGRANEILREQGENIIVHPNDHVNRSQSTNDVNPSALKVASVRLANRLLKVLDGVITAFEKKAREFQNIPKLGRTHLQDAVPTTLGAEFQSFAETLRRNQKRIKETVPYFLELNLGGTAIGDCVNASPKYLKTVYVELNKIAKLYFKPAASLMSQTSSQTDFAMMSQMLTLLCLDASKIANDIRLLSSGPKGGLGEIVLAELQKGSSIMPGKVNPILPETVNQLYFWVSGSNLSIEHAAQASQLELCVMGPTIADNLIMSLRLAAEVLEKFAKDCVLTLKANKEKCLEHLEKSTAYATLLSPKLGYDAAACLVKESVSSGKTIRALVLEKGLMDKEEFEKAVSLFKA
ncbi:MAG: aspartate ammonia-lyase [Patescibacteria group bacterium]|nr:aspartate ammonia-lyase [Patescibacteria group bacterium]